jgi:hypothetical protein
MRQEGYVTRMEQRRGAYSVLVRRPEGNRPHGRSRRRWENIKINFQEVGWGDGMYWSGSGLERVNAVTKCRVP